MGIINRPHDPHVSRPPRRPKCQEECPAHSSQNLLILLKHHGNATSISSLGLSHFLKTCPRGAALCHTTRPAARACGWPGPVMLRSDTCPCALLRGLPSVTAWRNGGTGRTPTRHPASLALLTFGAGRKQLRGTFSPSQRKPRSSTFETLFPSQSLLKLTTILGGYCFLV